MEPNTKVDPPQARDNTALFKKLEAEGKEILVFEGYKYIKKDGNTLIPQCGIIAQRKDYTPFDPIRKIYGNLNMNRYLAYCEAMEWLESNPIIKKGKKGTTPKDPIEPEGDEEE